MINTTEWYPIALAIQSKLDARHPLEDLHHRLIPLFHQSQLHEHDSALTARTAYLEVGIERGVGPAEAPGGAKQVPEPVSPTYRSPCRPGTGAGSESVKEEPEPLWKVCTGTAHEFGPKPPPRSSPTPLGTRKPGHGDRASDSEEVTDPPGAARPIGSKTARTASSLPPSRLQFRGANLGIEFSSASQDNLRQRLDVGQRCAKVDDACAQQILAIDHRV